MTAPTAPPAATTTSSRDAFGSATVLPAPRVTVIVRTRNRPDMLRAALESVCAQSYRPIELVVVNDGGDEVQDIVRDCEGELGSVLYQRLAPAQGRSAAANRGLEMARGELVIFLDDDDWFLPGHVARLVEALRAHPQAGVAYAGVECVEDDGEGGLRPVHVFDQGFDPIHLALQNYIPMHAALFRRELIDSGCRIDETLDLYEDWDFWIQLSERTEFIHVPGISAVYRIAGGGGFGVAADEVAVAAARRVLLEKWRSKWSRERFEGVIAYAMREKDYRFLHNELHVRDHQLNEARDQCDALAREQERLQSEMGELAAALDTARQHHTELERAASIWAQRVADMESSTSWRITAPVRTAGALARRAGRAAGTRIALARRNLALAWEVFRAEGMMRLLQRIHRRSRPRLRPRRAAAGTAPAVATAWGPLTLATVDQPQVSVIIPVHNQHLHTFTCLRAIAAAATAVPYEVIVVNDHSDSDTEAMLAAAAGVRRVDNAGDRGFVPACNLGAGHARGRYLVFLNNDTIVPDRWLERLVETFERNPQAGMVGVQLVYPDGRLQEAGGIVWRDGSAWNCGRDGDPDRPEFRYLREVDYCSGACLAVERTLFEKVGRFSDEFAPAYYEDVDLAFKIRAAGRTVLYQPAVRVVHFEGVSTGRRRTSGMKQYQIRNQRRLRERWSTELDGHRVNGVQAEREKHRTARGHALVIDAMVPRPDRDSGSLRMYGMLELIQSLGFQTTFLPADLDDGAGHGEALRQLGIEVLHAPYVRSPGDYLSEHGARFDVVVLSRPGIAARLLQSVRRHAPRARVVFDTVDLRFLREARLAKLRGSGLLGRAAADGEAEELDLVRNTDVTLVVSEVERGLLAERIPGADVRVVSNIVEVRGQVPGFDAREGIIFIGNFAHPPNTDAVLWLAGEILPRVRERLGEVPVFIVGNDPPARIRALATSGFTVTGHVPQLEPYLDRCRLSIAPLRYGAGVKGKVNTSMANGLPVVATTIAAEGMHLVHGYDVLIADEPDTLASAVANMYSDRALWEHLSVNGIENVRRHFSRAVAREAIEGVLAPPDATARPAEPTDRTLNDAR